MFGLSIPKEIMANRDLEQGASLPYHSLEIVMQGVYVDK